MEETTPNSVEFEGRATTSGTQMQGIRRNENLGRISENYPNTGSELTGNVFPPIPCLGQPPIRNALSDSGFGSRFKEAFQASQEPSILRSDSTDQSHFSHTYQVQAGPSRFNSLQTPLTERSRPTDPLSTSTYDGIRSLWEPANSDSGSVPQYNNVGQQAEECDAYDYGDQEDANWFDAY
ncbi:hypothetical protein GQ44DRAFT_362121 [Phaeosphaeriaceae sp. PMI808]|nr:hypothetical protein GQ44DRAFT_362121 [Phaeosphaeriaceae sp. PMI808]